MNILHVATSDLHGSRFNGYALKPVMARMGHNPRMAVWHKDSRDAGIMSIDVGAARLLQRLWARTARVTALEDMLSPAGLALMRHPWFRTADVIHAHSIDHDWFGALGLPLAARLKPVVWTAHSAVPATGGCYHPFECEKWKDGCRGVCPHPRQDTAQHRRSPALRWQIKRAAFRNMDVTLVAASSWTEAKLSRSPLTAHLPRAMIPFGVDLKTFTPGDTNAARARFAIAADARVLVFRAVDPTSDEFKGSAWLLEALERWFPAEPVTLLIVGDGGAFRRLAPRYRIVEAGWLNDTRSMVSVYQAADVLVMPSLAESFGMMAVESMACGTPVVVSEGTALPRVAHVPLAGLAVPARDSSSLAHAIEQLLTDDELRRRMGAAARDIAECEYDIEDCARRHLALYETVIARRHSRHVTGKDDQP